MADDKNSLQGNEDENGTNRSLTIEEERSEYFGKLEKWLQEAYAWQSVVAMFPYYVMSSQILNRTSAEVLNTRGAFVTLLCTCRRFLKGIAPFPIHVPTNVNSIGTVTNVQQTGVGSTDRQNNDLLRQRRPQEPTGPFRPPGAEGFEYRVPPIWKRFVAEFIDSLMLFILKLSITFIAVDFFDFINIERYDLDLIQTNLRIDYKMALEMTSGILILELIHRVIVCIFEAFWLQHGLHGRIGGATPGKTVMGLRVVQCRSITPIERPDGSDIVLVSPGTDLGLPLAIGRSVVKNLILAFLFPICFALFFFRFNRTGYDLICNSIVVEDPYRNANNNRLHQQ